MEESMPTHKSDSPDRQLAAFSRLTVARFMEKDVQVGHARTKADVLASQMIEGFGSVPIVDEQQRLIGIVSEHDLLAALEKGHKWSLLEAGDIMSLNPYSVRPETELGTLIHVLRVSQLIRVPVVDADGKLVGIVARRDILRGYLNYGLAPGA
ncbi:MAG: CBS domain-containing protein [Nitrospira sp.]|nr:CBS domain-containing protein [Nitrospira sp.]